MTTTQNAPVQDINALLAALSPAERRAFLGQARAVNKELTQAETARIHAAVREAVTMAADDVVANTQYQDTAASGWEGHGLSGIPVTLTDGRTVTVSMTVTMVKGTRKPKDS